MAQEAETEPTILLYSYQLFLSVIQTLCLGGQNVLYGLKELLNNPNTSEY